MKKLVIRPVGERDKPWVVDFVCEHWHAPEVVTHGKIFHPDELPGFVAEQGGHRIGLITYTIEGEDCEIITLNSLIEGVGIGTELLKAVIQAAIAKKCRRIFAVTTNDNVNALRFFQTRGFVLAALRRNVIEEARKLKPQIPSHGYDDIPIRDEIEIEMALG